MSKPRKFHLFNCDNIYELSVVEDLLKAAKSKLGFEFSVEKHSFTLREMSELSTKTIPEMKIDFAMFVVHAHESVLSINNDNLEHGYTKVYRALLQATGGNVIVVIGGDDNYKNETEEEQSVISRWAWRKIAHPQFKAEFIDGRKSFVFSWNKQHRAIHEEALLHYFDPSKKGRKFEYQPLQRSLEPETETAPPAGATEPGRNAADKDPERSSSSRESSGEMGNNIRARVRHTGKAQSEDLEILGCNLSENCKQAVRNIFQDISQKLNLPAIPLIENFPPVKVKQYLTEKHLKCCVLAVDAETLKDAYVNLSQRKVEYQELLETAENAVDEKVVILICETLPFKSKDDEAIVGQTIERIVNKKGKGFVAWLKDGKLSVDTDVLVQFLISPSAAPQLHTQTNVAKDSVQAMSNAATVSEADSFSTYPYQPRDLLQNQTYERERGAGWNVPNMQQPAPQAAATTQTTVMLRSLLRHGEISYRLEDLQIWHPDFIVPDYVKQSLLSEYCGTPEAGVTIVLEYGKFQCSVDPKMKGFFSKSREIKIDDNEILLLKTRVRYGRVSFDESDLHIFIRFKNWQIPKHITDSLEKEYNSTRCGDLFIISDMKGNLKCTVKMGNKDRMLNFTMKDLNLVLPKDKDLKKM